MLRKSTAFVPRYQCSNPSPSSNESVENSLSRTAANSASRKPEFSEHVCLLVAVGHDHSREPNARSVSFISCEGHGVTIARWIGRGTFKAAALTGAFVLIVVLWLWDASILTRAADENLRLIKAATRVLPLAWASKTESALRIFGADRALLLVEGVALAKLIMLGIAQPFRRGRPWRRN